MMPRRASNPGRSDATTRSTDHGRSDVVRQVRLGRPLELFQPSRNATLCEFRIAFEIAQLRDQRAFDVAAARRIGTDRMSRFVEHDVAVEAQIPGRRVDARVVNRQAQLIDRDDACGKQARLIARVQEYFGRTFFADVTDDVADEHERTGCEIVLGDRFRQRHDLADRMLHEELGIGIVPERERPFAIDAAFGELRQRLRPVVFDVRGAIDRAD